MTRIVIIGGVAGGATAAARARRLDEAAEITLVERGPYVSYANCGLPYFLSGDITDRAKLLLQTPASFARRYRVTALVHTEAVEIDRGGKRVRVTGPEGDRWLPYDKLILAQGGSPTLPPIPGSDAEHVFRLWTVPDMDRLDGFLRGRQPRHAVVVGGGFIGLEMAEAFRKRGLTVTIVEREAAVLPVFDHEFGTQVALECGRHAVGVVTGEAVQAIHADSVELTHGRRIPADLVLFSVGVRPELTLAKQAGLATGLAGGLTVDEHLRTSDPHIWAAGDMVEVFHRVSGRMVRIPLAGPANRQGRLAATNALGGRLRYGGALGTSVVKVFDATVAMTGLSEAAARAAGFEVGVAVLHKEHHAGYYPGGKELTLKLIYQKSDGQLLGAEAFGHAGVEKRIDVLAAALHGRMTLDDLAELDLAYAPPYSSANDPVNLAAFVGQNDISGFSPLVTAAELREELAGAVPPAVVDVRTAKEYAAGHLPGAVNVPVDDLRDETVGAGYIRPLRGRRVIVYCKGGFRGHLAVRILKAQGITDVANVTGGWTSMRLEGSLPVAHAEEAVAAGH
ncbi:MAG: FAD-dependent oxidoreductase [Gemmatimonadetes bacterium]|nr:FAD-dependent oxidoreductase [Gemmatimonadota bacterium]